MQKIAIRNVAPSAFAGVLMIVLVTGCANQGFQLTSAASLTPQGMQHLVLRAKYPENLAKRIPATTRRRYESAFLKMTNHSVHVVGRDNDPKPNAPYYYLQTEVTKYKPGSPYARVVPLMAFLGWGSFVYVDYSVCDPSTDVPLGNGVIRKANLWWGYFGQAITSETELEACPQEIMDELDSFMQK